MIASNSNNQAIVLSSTSSIIIRSFEEGKSKKQKIKDQKFRDKHPELFCTYIDYNDILDRQVSELLGETEETSEE